MNLASITILLIFADSANISISHQVSIFEKHSYVCVAIQNFRFMRPAFLCDRCINFSRIQDMLLFFNPDIVALKEIRKFVV